MQVRRGTSCRCSAFLRDLRHDFCQVCWQAADGQIAHRIAVGYGRRVRRVVWNGRGCVVRGHGVSFAGTASTSWQRLLVRARRALRAFESERTEDHSSWTLQVRLERDELDGGWIAECLDLPGCISEGETQAEAMANIADAVGEVIAVRMGSHVPDLAPDDDAPSGRELAIRL